MNASPHGPSVIVVRASGELDRSATDKLVADVRSQVTEKTELIVVSLEQTTTVRWNAICMLSRAARAWRDASYSVIVKEARPSLREIVNAI
jgi:hypothetical protein